MKAKFISLEGTEGTGKSTNLEFLKNRIEAAGFPLLVTREPGGTPLAEELRELLLAPREEKVNATAELLMIFAARAQHLNEVILPALQSGTWVLTDRFTDATYAYQGAGRGLSKEVILQLETLVQGSLRPDITFVLDIDVDKGLARARERADLDRFEQEEIGFFEAVRSGYHERIANAPERYFKIDAGQSLEKVQSDLAAALDHWLKGN